MTGRKGPDEVERRRNMGERRKKQIVIIDGQGGGFGRALIEKLRQQEVRGTILAVGTNSMATSAMLRAGADAGATGENAAVLGGVVNLEPPARLVFPAPDVHHIAYIHNMAVFDYHGGLLLTAV